MENQRLIQTIKQDCKMWENENNKDKMLKSRLYLQECVDSKKSNLYKLILNDGELWYGNLSEINAIVKSMIHRIKNNDFLDL